MDKVSEVLALDVDMKVSEMTVGQFLEAVMFREAVTKYEAQIKELRDRLAAVRAIEESSKNIFTNIERLSHQTTPFEIKDLEELDKLYEMLKHRIIAREVPIVALAFKQ